jgi:hypothetical protein
LTPELKRDPIIVYGAPRSGTTYLQQLLSSHPEVFVSDETRVFAWLFHALALSGDDRLMLNHRESITERLRASLPELVRDIYRDLAPGVRYWGDKNPHYADPYNNGCLEMILELFPASMFIHIIRDGRDVVSSLMRKSNEDKPWVDFKTAHFTWSSHLRRGLEFGRSLPTDQYFELRYERLVDDDVTVAKEMFSFLGLRFDPEVEEFCQAQREKRTPFKDPTRDLGKGVAASDWANVFSLEEQLRSLNLLGPQLVQHGYETAASLEHLGETIAERLAQGKVDASLKAADA